jgi:hypothetical protein
MAPASDDDPADSVSIAQATSTVGGFKSVFLDTTKK